MRKSSDLSRGRRGPGVCTERRPGRGRAASARGAAALAAAWLLMTTLGAGLARADLKSADEKFLHGDYAGAIADYRKVTGRDAPRAALKLGRALLRTGDLAGAETSARSASRASDKKVAADGGALLAEIYRATGRYAEARALLEKAVQAHPDHLRSRCQLGLVYLDLGERDLATAVFERFIDDYNSGAIGQDDAEGLLYVAIATRGVDAYQDANDTFRDAVNLDPDLLEANVSWGMLFLEKYEAGYAEQSFDEVLKVDPNHPDAHAGMARVKLEQGYDVRGALEHIDKALASHRRHPLALAARAELEIDNGQWADAEKTLGEILAVNPNDLEARSMRAAIRWLRDDTAGYEAERKATLAVNPRFARFYHVIADFAVKEHRYREAIRLEEQALQTDPAYYTAEAAIGIGYLRLGEEKKGLEHLNRAFERDPFNIRAYNTLNLFEGAIAKDYVVLDASRSFRLRMPKAERPVLERYAPALLEKAFADMVRRYGFTPTLPITIELYGDPQAYSVRTIGLPNLGALGVCFGQVITALSPANGNVNWGMVLWHELGHVFAIQLSGSRVPRWFTEGLSEYETILARPEWRRENDADVWHALDTGALPSVANLNTMFTRARDMQEMVVAYHLSSVAIEFIAKRWGFPKIVEALKLFGKGQETPEVLKAITGLDVAAFDAEFRRFLEGRLAAYKGTFQVRLARYSDLEALEKAAAARPKDADATADLALGYLAAGEAEKATRSAATAIALDPRNRKALWAQAELALARGDVAVAKERLGALVAAGGDGYDARLRLARVAIDGKDAAEAERELARAKALDPERSEPYSLLAEIFFRQGREEDAIRELERYAYLEQMEYGPFQKLVGKHAERRRWDKVREFGEMAVLINPYDPELHLALGQAHLELKANDAAIHELETALLTDPAPRRPAAAHVLLARAYAAKRNLPRARKALAAALKLEPTNAEALELKKKLR